MNDKKRKEKIDFGFHAAAFIAVISLILGWCGSDIMWIPMVIAFGYIALYVRGNHPIDD